MAQDRSRLHLHFAVGRFVKRSLIEAAWGRGFVHIKQLGDLRVGSGVLEESRRAGGYLSKYVGKGFDDERRAAGLHRFDVAEGFQPATVRLTGRSAWDVVGQASAFFGGVLPARQWSSAEVEDWHGAPAIWALWA